MQAETYKIYLIYVIKLLFNRKPYDKYIFDGI